MKITVGSFSIEDGTITGPADYMAEAFDAMLAKIEAGQSAVFNYGIAHVGEPGYAADTATALLVTIQTDYAGWHGSKVFFDRIDAGLVPETGLPV